MVHDSRPDLTRDLRTLIEQVHAGVILLEEYQDSLDPSGRWANAARRNHVPTAARYAWGDLAGTWINLVHTLLDVDPDAEPWEIAPLPMRSADGQRKTWEIGPDRSLALSDDDHKVHHDLARKTQDSTTVRPVDQPTEPRYTLDEARRILAVCQTHDWDVETDEGGHPTGVRCKHCDERRSMR